MSWTNDQLQRIFDRTQGRCHICGKRRVMKNYGVIGARGCWSVEHSIPQARGGSHHGNNLFPACISCNSRKGSRSTRSVRAMHGRTRAPHSSRSESNVRTKNAVAGGGFGAVIGGVLAGPPGAWIGGILGGMFGHSADPEDN